jgi:hypothetical protein
MQVINLYFLLALCSSYKLHFKKRLILFSSIISSLVLDLIHLFKFQKSVMWANSLSLSNASLIGCTGRVSWQKSSNLSSVLLHGLTTELNFATYHTSMERGQEACSIEHRIYERNFI